MKELDKLGRNQISTPTLRRHKRKMTVTVNTGTLNHKKPNNNPALHTYMHTHAVSGCSHKHARVHALCLVHACTL